MATVGKYTGPPPGNPNADIRMIFTERANQQDGLATILKYCQDKVGFTVGSTNTIPVRALLLWEFSNVLKLQIQGYQAGAPAGASAGVVQSIEKITAEGVSIGDDPEVQTLYVPPYPPAYLKFLKELQEGGWSYKSLIVFATKDESNQLSLVIDENHVVRVGSQQGVNAFNTRWIVDRDAMARQADWLVDKLKIKDSLENWNRRITSPGY
ncbi:hypothetical protein DFQ27_005915 [Actinomortierella ambigua]|uniref:Uncharacterized protein n=1 Tax=Actinomortierella ambigua TaxID=1343610 RepID=A0A9P6PXS7_9FUNG|nr:hypothetical protein DFQ27_005915 [Actinomortierella ambigua]